MNILTQSTNQDLDRITNQEILLSYEDKKGLGFTRADGFKKVNVECYALTFKDNKKLFVSDSFKLLVFPKEEPKTYSVFNKVKSPEDYLKAATWTSVKDLKIGDFCTYYVVHSGKPILTSIELIDIGTEKELKDSIYLEIKEGFFIDKFLVALG